MDVRLTKALEEYVEKQVASGLYSDVSEVIREAIRLKMQLEVSERTRLEALRPDIDVGWQQADRGQFANYDIEAIRRRLDEELDASADG